MTPEKLVNELTRLRLKDGDIIVWRTNDPESAREDLVDMWKDRAFAKDVAVLLIRPGESFAILTDEDLANAGLRRLPPVPEPHSRSQARRLCEQTARKVEYPEEK